jgi:hypothetical protein
MLPNALGGNIAANHMVSHLIHFSHELSNVDPERKLGRLNDTSEGVESFETVFKANLHANLKSVSPTAIGHTPPSFFTSRINHALL